jgi:hypothetical protein
LTLQFHFATTRPLSARKGPGALKISAHCTIDALNRFPVDIFSGDLLPIFPMKKNRVSPGDIESGPSGGLRRRFSSIADALIGHERFLRKGKEVWIFICQ